MVALDLPSYRRISVSQFQSLVLILGQIEISDIVIDENSMVLFLSPELAKL